MITSIFSKSKPINFLIVAIGVLLVYAISNLPIQELTFTSALTHLLRLLSALFFVFLLDFIIAKNDLTKKNSYGIMLLLLLFAGFHETLKETNVLLSSLFVCFAFRRLGSLHTHRHIKKKYFDAALWIALATLCYSWAALFFILQMLALVYYWQNDIKNIIVSFLGVFTIGILTMLHNILYFDAYINPSLFEYTYSFNFSYFNNAAMIYALTVLISLFIWSLFHFFRDTSDLNKKAKPKFILVAVASLIALALVIITPNKNGSELLFLFVPFSIVVANYLQNVPVKWFKEVLITLLLVIPILRLFL